MSISNDFNKENYQFYFPVVGYFDGDQIRFMIATEQELRGGKYIFDLSKEDWITINTDADIWDRIEDLDLEVASELVYRLSVIGKDNGGE